MTTPYTDPFLYFGLGFLVAHLVQYYMLLDKISKRIRSKEQEDIDKIKSQINNSLTPDKVIELHKDIHKIETSYESLQESVIGNFHAGTALLILTGIGYLRNFFSFITPDIVTIIQFIMIIAGASFVINFWKLLNWNLKNK